MEKLHFDFTNLSMRGSTLFRKKLPEGNYRIRLSTGESLPLAPFTIKTGSRRILIRNWPENMDAPEDFAASICVMSHTLQDGREIPLDEDEQLFKNWSGELILEFLADHFRAGCLDIEKDDSAKTLYLAGDSTVTDQERVPYSAWGQILPAFFREGAAVANFAKSGASVRSSLEEHRFDKIFETMKAGDYLFLQFGHNDQKTDERHSDAWGDYQGFLREICRKALELKAHPVLLTSMQRRKFDAQGMILHTLEDYPDAVRSLAEETSLPLIDLNRMTKILYETLGPERSKRLFLHIPADRYPGQKAPLKDDTHFSTWGAWELAQCVVSEIYRQIEDLRPLLRENPDFDPSSPDNPEDWFLPESLY